MPITNIYAEVVLPDVDGLPADEAVFGLAFIRSDTTGLTATISDLLNATGTGGTNQISTFIGASRTRATSGCSIRYYDVSAHLDGSPHGGPFEVDTFTLGAPSTDGPLPDQVAQTVSFYDALTSAGDTTGRHRGRVYLGPLNEGTLSNDTNHHGVPASAWLNDVKGAFTDFLTAESGKWAVWSRANATMLPVIGGFIKDTFDTQRRRQVAATSRHSFA